MNSLDKFAAAGPQDMRDWLEARLQNLYSNDRVRSFEANRFVDYGIEPADSFMDMLVMLFQRLPPLAQQSFRRAVGLLLRQAQPRAFPQRGMMDLVLLLGHTSAHDELSALSDVVGNGDWGAVAPELFYGALAVLKGLSHGSLSVYDTVSNIKSARHFPKRYVFDVYEVCVRANADSWRRSLETLAPMMLAQEPIFLAQVDSAALAKRYASMFDVLVDGVSLQQLAAGIRGWASSAAYMRATHPVGRLLELLAADKLSVRFEFVADGSELVLRRKSNQLIVSLQPLHRTGDLFIQNAMSNAWQISRRQPPVPLSRPAPDRGGSDSKAALETQVQLRMNAVCAPAYLE